MSYRYLAKLAPETKASFLGNLGQLSYYLNNYACALQAYQGAVALDASPAQKQHDQDSASKMATIVGPQSGAGKCGASEYFPAPFKETTIRGAGVADLGAVSGRGDQAFVACEIDAAQPEDAVQLGYIDARSRGFHPLIEVQKTLRYTCGKLAFAAGLGHVAARIKIFAAHPVTVQVFRLSAAKTKGA